MKIGHSFTSEATLQDLEFGVKELCGKVTKAGHDIGEVKFRFESEPRSLDLLVVHIVADLPDPAGPVCGSCRRERTIHGMDAYDYSPLQVITGQPVGWYSGDDGEMCPECMAEVLGRQQ